MNPKFLVLSLPRSRSAWLSRFLSYRGARCGHDVAIQCESVAAVKAVLGTYDGSCETGAMLAGPALKTIFPNTRLILVRRPVDEVVQSFTRNLGLMVDVTELHRRNVMLNEIAAMPDVLSFDYADLIKPQTCAAIFEACLNRPFNEAWWRDWDMLNVQVNMPAWLKVIEATEAGRLCLRTELEAMVNAARTSTVPDVTVAAEKVADVWNELALLGADHFAEVDGGVDEPNRHYKLDRTLLQASEDCGMLYIVAARVSGKLAAYIMWQIGSDVECEGLRVAEQGPWFCDAASPVGGLGMRVFRYSVDALKAAGIQNLTLHHRLHGRGAKLGAFYKRLGARETKHEYSLWIGD